MTELVTTALIYSVFLGGPVVACGWLGWKFYRRWSTDKMIRDVARLPLRERSRSMRHFKRAIEASQKTPQT